jgi:phage gp29-like protein
VPAVTFYRAAIALAAVLLLWAGFALSVTAPPDRSDYRRTAVQAAESARDAASTGALIARQQIDHDVFGTFATAAYDDATRTVAGAAEQIAAQSPPDAASADLRDSVLPLVQEAVRALGDAARATTRAALRAAQAALDDVAGQLGDLIEAQQ